MTTDRLHFCLATVLMIGGGAASAHAQAAAPAPVQPPAATATGPAMQMDLQPRATPPAQPYPAGQPAQGQPYPAQPYSGQPYPGQPAPGQPYPAQPYPGQPYPGQPYPPPQPYAGQPYPPPYPPQPYAGQVYPGAPPALNTTLHIDSSDREATLFQHTGSSAFVGYAYRGAMVGSIDFWQRICRAPCDQPVDTNATYSIRGNGIVPSGPFSLPVGQARVNVQAGHTGPRIGGWLLTTLGGATFLGGATLIGMGALFKSVSSTSESSLSRSAGSYMVAGGVTMAIGAGALAGGIVLIVKSRTQVQINGEASAQLHLPGGRPLYVNSHGLVF